jgi:hypothetical protein
MENGAVLSLHRDILLKEIFPLTVPVEPLASKFGDSFNPSILWYTNQKQNEHKARVLCASLSLVSNHRCSK